MSTTDFENWYWSTNLTKNTCPGTGFGCSAPHACARDPKISKWYCCNANTDPFDVCWTGATTCSNDEKTFECRNANAKWCCLKGSEVCTSASDQINLCWSTGFDLLKRISIPAIESAHSSLSAATPDASSIRFDPLSIIALTASPSSSSTTSSSSTPGTTASIRTSGTAGTVASPTDPAATSQSASGSSQSSSTRLEAGAIAGVAVGGAVALALIVLAIFLWRRRNKRKSAAESPSSLLPPGSQQIYYQQGSYDRNGNYHAVSSYPSEMPGSGLPQQPYHQELHNDKNDYVPATPELAGHTPRVEMPPNHAWQASELPGSHVQQQR